MTFTGGSYLAYSIQTAESSSLLLELQKERKRMECKLFVYQSLGEIIEGFSSIYDKHQLSCDHHSDHCLILHGLYDKVLMQCGFDTLHEVDSKPLELTTLGWWSRTCLSFRHASPSELAGRVDQRWPLSVYRGCVIWFWPDVVVVVVGYGRSSLLNHVIAWRWSLDDTV